MSHKFLMASSFHSLLTVMDYELAEQERVKGCVYCGGRLHRSNYPRSPFGVPMRHRAYYEERFSHCCGVCRKRTTPPSVRFFGRYWFPAPLLILISALANGVTNKLCSRLKRLFGVMINKKTWKRWQRWWRDIFGVTPFWKGNTGIIPIAQLTAPFPRALLVIYSGTLQNRLVSVLQFLAPLTAGVLRAV